jgi:hypothetical protein
VKIRIAAAATAIVILVKVFILSTLFSYLMLCLSFSFFEPCFQCFAVIAMLVISIFTQSPKQLAHLHSEFSLSIDQFAPFPSALLPMKSLQFETDTSAFNQ